MLLVVAEALLGATPNNDAGDAKWRAWFEDSGHRAQQITGMYLTVAAGLLLVAFMVVLLRHAHAGGANDLATSLAGAFGVILATIVVASGVMQAAVSAAVTFAPNKFPVPSADIERVLAQVGTGTFLVGGGLTAAAFVYTTSLSLRHSTMVPGWLVATGYTASVLLLASFAFLPLALLPLWALAVGIAMVARPSPPTTATPWTTANREAVTAGTPA